MTSPHRVQRIAGPRTPGPHDPGPHDRGPRTGPRTRAVLAIAVAAAGIASGCSDDPDATPRPAVTIAPPSGVDAYEVEVVARHPHDTDAFTQGLLVDSEGRLLEGTGREGRSELRVVDLTSGEVQRSVDLPDDVFGEGVTEVDGRLVQLTWQDGTAYVWDSETLEQEGTFTYEGEGWGLCTDGSAGDVRLVRSDGTSTLTFHDPTTFEVEGTVDVSLEGRPVTSLNELECVDGDVWANVWQTDTIVQIDLGTGEVVGVVDAASLIPADERVGIDVLNGIAKVPGGDTWYVTGKLWPTLFEVRFVPVERSVPTTG